MSRSEGRRDQLFGPVITMNLDHPYKAATIEECATVSLRPGPPGCSSLPYSGTEGVLPNVDITATSGVAARCYNPGRGLHEPSAPQR
jgi:hypothetical protein